MSVNRAEPSFAHAVAEFDSGSYAAFEHEAEEQRLETLRRYPRDSWPTLRLEDYAQGQSDHPENFCRWIERQTDGMGSIRGGSARKLIIYKHRDRPGWYFPAGYADERVAWDAVRAAFVHALGLADEGRWGEIDEIEPLHRGAALLAKTLWVYFPTQMLPITSSENLRHFLRIVGREDVAADQSVRTVQLNRTLLSELRNQPTLADASTKVLERLLYMRFSPFEGRVVKISPGEDARFWHDCRAGGFICVGWEEVGDLRQYASKEAFLAAFRESFGTVYTSEQKLKEKADEVWLLLDLAVGERIVANKGTKEVLAVGTVQSPGYVWAPDRTEYQHTVRVEWDESYAREIPAQPYWAFKTVYTLPSKVRALVLDDHDGGTSGPEQGGHGNVVDPIFRRIEEALERKSQAILYGPPGTGKTWHAGGFATSWLKRRNSNAPPMTTPPAAVGRPDGARAWLVSTRPSEWRWDELFANGEEQFRRGRLTRNYDIVSPGDLVFGYTATPEKRIEALARIARLVQTDEGSTFVLAPLGRVHHGPTWDELQADDYLAGSEPVRNRFQGTLFQLTAEESERLMALISERDPDAATVRASEATQAHEAPDALGEALEWVTFHPSYSYEDFVEGFRPSRTESGSGLMLEDGIFKTMCARALANPGRTYLLVIDEINRTNVTKVFGELITLIETDKRAGSTDGRYSVRLPYSKERLVVPQNLFILGTMNTADRSIKMMDTALRRRFGFVELMPDPALLLSEVGGLRLDELLRALNKRVAKTAGREKQVGHSFFLRNGQPISDETEFAQVFRDEVVPLLQEYAADDYDELAEYLGPRIVDADELVLDEEVLSDSSQLLEALEDHLLGTQPES